MYKLHDSKPRPSRPTSSRQQSLYPRAEKPSQGQMASDAMFQAGAVEAGPVCTGEVWMSLTDLRTSVTLFQAGGLSQRFTWVFSWALVTDFQFWSCRLLSVSSRGVQRHRDKLNPSFPHNPVKATRSTSVPMIFPLVITKLQQADPAPRDPATEGGARLGVSLVQPTRPWCLITCLQKKPCCRTGEGKLEMETGHLCKLSLPPGLRHERIVGSLAIILPLLPEVQFSVDSHRTSQTRPAS